MPQQPQQLAPTQDVRAHHIASLRHYRGDIALLNYLLQDLRALIRRHHKDEIAIHPHQVFTWDVHGLERRTVLCDPISITEHANVQIVGFFGDRRERTDQDQIDASEFDLISEFVHYPGILSYSSIELVDHYWANLVVHTAPDDREAWRQSDAHKNAVDVVAPEAYHGVRIHNGCIAGGVLGSETVTIDSTKYWDYDDPNLWHAIRQFPQGASEVLEGPVAETGPAGADV